MEMGLSGMSLTGMLVGFDFAQPTLRHIKGFADLTMLIERAIRVKWEFI